MQSDLGPGDEVVTIGGLYGTVTGIEDDTVLIEVAPGVQTRYARPAIARVVTRAELPERAGHRGRGHRQGLTPPSGAASPAYGRSTRLPGRRIPTGSGQDVKLDSRVDAGRRHVPVTVGVPRRAPGPRVGISSAQGRPVGRDPARHRRRCDSGATVQGDRTAVAPPQGQMRPGRQLAVLGFIFVVLYLLVFFARRQRQLEGPARAQARPGPHRRHPGDAGGDQQRRRQAPDGGEPGGGPRDHREPGQRARRGRGRGGHRGQPQHRHLPAR